MKRNFVHLIAVACSFIFFTAFVFADLNGKWTGVIKTPDGNELQVSYNFKVDGDKLTGTAESPAGQVTVDNGKMIGDTAFTFKVTVDGNDYQHSGRYYKAADSCAIDIDFGAQKAHTTLKRATADH